MLALISFSAASVLDEHTAFDGVIQFDALQTTTPGAPGTVASTSFTTCPASCNDADWQTGAKTGIASAAGISTSQVTITCTTACTAARQQARALKAIPTSLTALITILNATPAQLQALQNQINAGNLIFLGIGSSVALGPSTTPLTQPAAQALVGVTPLNPSSPLAATACASNNARLACIGTVAGQTPLQVCTNTMTSIYPIQAYCCPCPGTTGGNYQVVAAQSTTTFAQLCLAVPVGYVGCGKRGSKKGLLGLLGLLGLIPLLLCLLICCLCCLRRKRRGQAMLFSQTAVPAPIPAPMPHIHAEPHLHAGPDFHVHP